MMSKAKNTILPSRRMTTPGQLAVYLKPKLWMTLPDPGGHRGEAALIEDRDRCCDRNRRGAEQNEFYHGKISIFGPSV